MVKNRILVAYFSRTGNTRVIANRIHDSVGGDIFEIVPVDPYPTDYNATVDRARRELDGDFRPELATELASVDSYDVVFVGYPCWWGTMPMAVFTFLEAHDTFGRTIIPFCTHEGSHIGRSVKDIAELCPHSTILSALAVRGSTVENAKAEVSEWLSDLGMK